MSNVSDNKTLLINGYNEVVAYVESSLNVCAMGMEGSRPYIGIVHKDIKLYAYLDMNKTVRIHNSSSDLSVGMLKIIADVSNEITDNINLIRDSLLKIDKLFYTYA